MLWCFANGVRYDGVDINAALRDGYERMMRDFGMQDMTFTVADAADYIPQRACDAVLTCPPYGGIEIYSENGAENLDAYAFGLWWRAVVRNAVSMRPEFFCVQVNRKYRDMMGDAIEREGYRLLDELWFGGNKSSHFTRRNGQDVKTEKESMLVFKRK